MAKYVLLAFDDDKDADQAVQMIQASRCVRWGHGLSLACKVRGMWKKPTKFCEGGGCSTSKKRPAFTRGTKYGWWVCANCGRPSRAWAKGDAWYTALGTNLLPITDETPEYRGPLHKQHPGYKPKETS
jgi:hypothetical protein